MICIIDYGMGNIGSLENMILKVGGTSKVISSAEEVNNADKLLLPGVGHFDNAVTRLKEMGLWDAIDNAVLNKKTPILCICLGAQLVTEHSEEGEQKGFGWIPGRTIKFQMEGKLKVPHMGWNNLSIKKAHPLLKNVKDGSFYYFVHSYYCEAAKQEDVAASCRYGDVEFCASIWRDNIMATQFHPEKSQDVGLSIFKNFAEL